MTSRRILVLGGTSWLGGTIARIAQDRGNDVTCLARGQSGTVPDGVNLVQADRWEAGAYVGVADQDWDAVIDVSWQPELVRSALAALARRTRHWVYVSSISAYRDHSEDGTEELHEPWTGTGEATGEDYGPAKVSCETACIEAVPAEQLLIARVGLIAGYGDRSDRFGYWPARVESTDSPQTVVLVPPMETPVQVIDVEDLAGWLVTTAERGTSGTYDVAGDVFGFEELLGECADVSGKDPTFAAPEQDWLIEQGVEPWAGPESLPLWLPVPEYARMTTHSNDAAKKVGLELRPLRETVVSALAWERELGLQRDRRAGLSPEREVALIKELLGDAVE
jgi:2'-hydroxyisoflavone reductase